MTYYVTTPHGMLEIDSPREPEQLTHDQVAIYDFAGRLATVVEGQVANELARLVVYEDEATLSEAWASATARLDEPLEEWLRQDGTIWPDGPGAAKRKTRRGPLSVEEKEGA